MGNRETYLLPWASEFDLGRATTAAQKVQKKVTFVYLPLAILSAGLGCALAYYIMAGKPFAGSLLLAWIALDILAFGLAVLLLISIRQTRFPVPAKVLVGPVGVQLAYPGGRVILYSWQAGAGEVALTDSRSSYSVDPGQALTFSAPGNVRALLTEEAYVGILSAARERNMVVAEVSRKVFGATVSSTVLGLRKSNR